MTDDKERLLAVLVNSTRPMRILVLTKAVGIEKKQLNKLLYCLQERGMVERTSETPPLWMATVAAVNGEYSTDETTLISLLTERGQHGMSTSTIASFLRKSVAVVNKMLYGLERESEVHRLSICPPVWKATCNRASTSEGASYNSSSGSEGTSSDSADTLVADIKKRPAKTAFSEESEANQSATKRYENTCVSKADGKRLRMSSPANSQSTSTVQVATADQQKDARSTPHSLSKVAPLTTADSEKVHHDADASKKQASWARQCSDAIWTKYRQLNTNAKDNDILAGFILREDHGSQKTARVVAIGSGTKCAVGNNFSLVGCVVHDSHAEIVARRSLIRWLYAQLAKAGSEGSLCSRCSDRSTPYVFHKVQLWFYVSQAPCGDCAIFSRSDPRPESVPCWTSKKQGKLRLKVEAGQGTFIPGSGEKQTTDGLMKGDRAKNHSCSDKMAKWSVLGVQGALLSRLMPPLYISGVVVSEVFSYGHICRGLCCRSERALHDTQATLPTPFEVAHPQIVHAPISITRAAQIKKHGNESHNWMELDSAIETVDGTTGRRVENRSESRICKRHLLASFCGLSEGPSAVSRSYSENKLLAVSYQEAKQIWIDAMATSYGFWQSKPSEFDEFSISFNSPAPTV